jgi:hypothetical protein
MSTGVTIVVVVAALAVIALLAVTALRGGGTALPGVTPGGRLKRRFGPEYTRALEAHDGDERATRDELSERVRRYGDIARTPLAAQERERYTQRWAEIQAHFVDEPGTAVTEADALIGELAADRGFPAADSPEHFDALSVHHPHQVHGYRQAHALAGQDAMAKRSTEDLRKALLAARGLHDELLHDDARAAVAADGRGTSRIAALTGGFSFRNASGEEGRR